MTYQEEKLYVGNREQLFSVKESRLCGGRQDGVRVVDISNGGDLFVSVAADRCMDIPVVRYKGRCLNYVTPNGMSHPAYYQVFGEGWIEAFSGGLLYTCGLSHAGLKSDADWLTQKEHGCIANKPAEHLNIRVTEEENGPVAELSGTMVEATLAGVNLKLTRTIRIPYKTNEIEVIDVISNEGFRPAPHMQLYHCNMGYPLLQPDTVCSIDYSGVRGRTEFAEKCLPQLGQILPPQDELEETCYYYDVVPDETGWAHVRLTNRRENLKFTLSYRTAELDGFVQWNNFVKGEYCMGLEPCNCTIDGREDAIARDAVKTLAPGKSVEHRLKFTFEDAE